MTAVFRRVHIRVAGMDMFTVKQLTEDINQMLKNEGEPYSLTPRKVGAILGSLGFRTHKLGSLGRGLKMSTDLIMVAHANAKCLGICVGDPKRGPGRSPRPLRRTPRGLSSTQALSYGLQSTTQTRLDLWLSAVEFARLVASI